MVHYWRIAPKFCHSFAHHIILRENLFSTEQHCEWKCILARCHSLIIVRTKEKANVLIRKKMALRNATTSAHPYESMCYNMLFCKCIFQPPDHSSPSSFDIIIIIIIPLRLLCNRTDTLNIVHTHAMPKILQAVPHSLLLFPPCPRKLHFMS